VENQWGTRDLLDKDLNEEIKRSLCRNETLFFNKRNETERYFFRNRNRKPKRNKYFSETKRSETRKKLCFLIPGFDTYYGIETVPRQVSFQHLKVSD
jgi:hypothetical protein